MNIERLLQLFKSTNYLEIIILGANIMCGILTLKNNSFIAKLFSLYFSFNAIVILSSWCMVVFPSLESLNRHLVRTELNTAISLLELFVYSQFFKGIIKNELGKNFLSASLIIFSALVFLYFFTRFSFLTHRFRYVSFALGVLEFFILIPPSLIYFYELLKTDSVLSLNNRPSFWIATGIFSFCIISAPFYLLNPILFDLNYQWKNLLGTFLFEFPLLLNLGFLTKALLCKKPLTI